MKHHMKKVLIFSLAYYPHVGGAEVALKEITDRISPNDIEFHMVTLRFGRSLPREERVGNVLVHRIGVGSSRIAKFFFQFYAPLVAARLHQKHHFGATWAIMAHSAGVPAALFKLFYSRIPMLLTLQEGDPPAHIERTMLPVWPFFSRAFTHADAVQAISTFLGAWARQRHFVGPLEIIPNGVDIQRFTGEPVPHAGTVLITSSRLVHKNAIDTIIRALALLSQEVSLVVAGSGPDGHSLKQLAHERGVAERVVWKGHVDHAQLPALLHGADIFIRPSRSEGMGNSFIEAMAAGIPVIGTQEGGITDFLIPVQHPVLNKFLTPGVEQATGWAVDKDSPEQIAQAVQHILAHPEEVRQTVRNAKKLVSEKYDWNLIAQKMRVLFGRVFAAGTIRT